MKKLLIVACVMVLLNCVGSGLSIVSAITVKNMERAMLTQAETQEPQYGEDINLRYCKALLWGLAGLGWNLSIAGVLVVAIRQRSPHPA